MKSSKTLFSIIIFTTVSCLIFLATSQPLVSACTINLGRGQKTFDIELSPPERIFHPDEDGYFYPGSGNVTKFLKVNNVGDLPFRLCMLVASFSGDVELTEALQIEILELGKGRHSVSTSLYAGALSNLGEGVDVIGRSAVSKNQFVILQISVWMPRQVGNEYQGLTAIVDLSVAARFQPSYNGGSY